MQPLEKSLRNKLEKTIKDARDIAEDAARAALEQLGVGEPTAYPHLTETNRKLRRKLRAHGRQLGNGRNAKGEQALDRLIEEVAYEHWHRMLFARFLAENNLLMYPDPDDPVAVTLEECEDLAADEGASNGWELASRYAARMLPQIFRPDSPVFQLTLPPEHQQKLERLIADLSNEVFTASDSLGWVYQFWQAKKKDEINASEVKIGARELPAVTQLFTEPYMVSFLLDNSLGAWWVKQLTVVGGQWSEKARGILRTAENEQELRDFFSIPGVPLSYLRFVQTENSSVLDGSHWMPAAGWFDGWPEKLAELKILDLCCGSGHFLVAAFQMLVSMRIALEGLSVQEAVDRVLNENIHGLELDPRCVELAAFALALAAWCYPDSSGYRQIPELNIACSGLAISAKKEEWLNLAGTNTNLRMVLELLYKQFKDAPILGSLINPESSFEKGTLFEHKWEEVGPLLTKALSGEKDEEKAEMGVLAQGIAKSAALLRNKYDWVITNVPYLGRGKQSQTLIKFCEMYHFEARQDLATVFLDRCLRLCETAGVTALVTPQNWFYQTTYKEFRKYLLKNTKWCVISRLGAGAFDTITGEVVKAALSIIKRNDVSKSDSIIAFDVSSGANSGEKAQLLRTEKCFLLNQLSQLKNPDSIVIIGDIKESKFLYEFADSLQGLSPADSPRYLLNFWELGRIGFEWNYCQRAAKSSCSYAGRESIVRMKQIQKATQGGGAYIRGEKAWGKKGVSIGLMSKMPHTLYTGEIFGENNAVLLPYDTEHLQAIWAYATSGILIDEVRKINPSLAVKNGYLNKVPFDLEYWKMVAEKKYPKGLPKPFSDDPTQWIFHGHPCGSVVWDDERKWTAIGPLRTDSAVLQVAVARLLGYHWPAELDAAMELSDEARARVKESEFLQPQADDDGIVCIPPVSGEMKAEDRLENLLAAAYGSEWSSNKKAELLAQTGHAGKTLDTWLRDKFFIQHCKLFQHRPFIWHIWDGLSDGFAALVNYHKLDAKLLETLIYNYLGDWISRQKQDIGNGVDGAQEKLAAAEVLKKKLELILEGEGYPDKKNPEKSYGYDIFVRWKPIEKQPIGWNPDLNDGVRLNIRPFMTVPDVGKKGAGILRDKPNIKWGKDRGKDVASAPWYHMFKGDRINDYHLGLEEKLAARQQQEKDGQK